MADSDKNIKITPNIGATSVPVIEFVGQGSQSMFLRVLDGSTASLAFEASEGQLFSITNNLSQGTIFSVNDISGIPFIELDASGTVSLNRFTGNTGIGTGAPTTKLEVVGTISSSNLQTGVITASSITSTNIFATTLTASTGNVTTLTVTNLTATNVTASSRIFVGVGSTTSPSIVAINDTNTGIYFPTADTIGFVEGGVESARLDSSGNFGLGTTNPSERLMIVNSSTNDIGIGVYNSTAYGAGNIAGSFIQLGKQESTVKQPMAEISGNPEVDNDSTPGMMLFKTRQGGSLSEKMRIRASGNVGIGTGTPSQKLEVVGAISATAFISTVASGTAPFTVSSTTSVVNLNADLLDGQHGSYYTNRDVGSIVYSYKNFGGAL